MIARPFARPGTDPSSDLVRDRIAATMVDLIGNQGYATVTLPMLCERAGIQRHHFDSRFADKEECFLWLYDEIDAQLCHSIQAAYEGPDAWHDRIWAAGWAAMRFFREDPVRARFFFAEAPGLVRSDQVRRERAVSRIATLIDAGRAELKEPNAIAACTARISAGAIFDTVLAKVRGGWIERGEEFLPELIYMVVLPYLGLTVAEDELSVKPLRQR